MKCLYHNDMDGRCSGNIVSHFENDINPNDFFEVDYVMDLTPMLDKVRDKEKVYFVDYSFTEPTIRYLKDLVNRGCDVVWIDHHTSSINIIDKYPELNQIKGIRSDLASGAALTYMYLYNMDFDSIPYYIKLVSDYDCWKFNYDDTMYFKYGINTNGEGVLSDTWNRLFDGSKMRHSSYIYSIIDIGKIVNKYKDKDNKSQREQYCYESKINNIPCLVINRRSDSTIFGELYNKYPIVCTWVFNGEKYSYSIYSGDKDIDCSKIAEQYGGGGHKSASGFTSTELLFKEQTK